MHLFVYICCLFHVVSSQNDSFHLLSRFWTNTGFCPLGNIQNTPISNYLLSNEMKIHLQLIGALPNEALSNIRIHWLLELIELVEYEKHHIPKYDFSKLDKFIWWLDRAELYLGFELMGNPSEIFTKNQNESIIEFLWEDLAFQIGKRYLNRLGPSKLKQWRFESWNEPDLKSYNILQFKTRTFEDYLFAIRRGLNAAGRRPLNGVNFKLHGPAGLFKNLDHHPLCWQSLQKCNENPKHCPFDVITYHHKGSGISSEVASGGQRLIKEIFYKFPNLNSMPFANNEADPIAGWSTPRSFQSDVRYAISVISIVFDHWTAKLNTKEFQNLQFISHDNAFISYHPHEFSQRTLFAHFRMNNSKPQPYSQFIQKPVYAVLGMMGNLGTHAADIKIMPQSIRVLETTDNYGRSFLSLIAISDGQPGEQERFQKEISLRTMIGKRFSYIVEFLEYQNTDPVYIWNLYGSPPFPNSTIREAMRKDQGPKLYTTGILSHPLLHVNLPIRSPWVVHVRMCSDLTPSPHRPQRLHIYSITSKEILLIWKEKYAPTRCVVTYQVWFLRLNGTTRQEITAGWHTPFLSFHFAPEDRNVKGTYAVRSVDTFGRLSEFSKTKQHI
ncbi:alpha-L-iduronidase [Episyrphus balteatus]|uniref:alpha-L-iduronidase n=1 Tax=Episyrphus balteatus TaxID=286459 RepID=UPI0024856A69|nr:alpha-L-iduronidase [Episyrphus balteatus]